MRRNDEGSDSHSKQEAHSTALYTTLPLAHQLLVSFQAEQNKNEVSNLNPQKARARKSVDGNGVTLFLFLLISSW